MKKIENSVKQGQRRTVALDDVRIFGSKKAIDFHMELVMKSAPNVRIRHVDDREPVTYRDEAFVEAQSPTNRDELTWLVELSSNYQRLTGMHLPIPFTAVDRTKPYISFKGELVLESAKLTEHSISLKDFDEATLNVSKLEEFHDATKKEHAVVLSESAWTSVLEALEYSGWRKSGMFTYKKEEVNAFIKQLGIKLKGDN